MARILLMRQPEDVTMRVTSWLMTVGALGLLGGCSAAGEQVEVGDDIDGGKVTDVAGDGQCRLVTVQFDPEWKCSDEQLALLGTSGFVPELGDAMGGGAPLDEAVAVELTATSCEGLADLRRPALKQQQRRTLDGAQSSMLHDKCVGKTAYRYYQGKQEVQYCSVNLGGPYASGTGGTASSGPYPGGQPSGQPPSDDGEGASEYSTTNTQVIGVDEADFVKNDAEHVYVLSKAGLHVIDAWPAPETKEIKRLALPGDPRRLFLDGDRLVVYTRLGGDGAATSDQGCTYGYDCRFSAEPGQTIVLVYDVSEPADPKELRRYAFSGNYVASRRVGRYVYTVVQDGDMASLPGVDLTLNADSPEGLATLYAERSAAADAAVDEAPAVDFLPWVHQLDPQGAPMANVESCDNALAASAARGQSFVSLVSFDLGTLAQPSRTLVAGKPGYVYASGTALYLASDGADGSDVIYRQQGAQDRSTVHKFALDGASTTYRGSAAIPGHVLNQFSMDERDGVLRVATSTGWVPDPTVSSSLVTLAEKDGKLAPLGSLGGIAPSEDIRSVRFDGTRAFVVTFKKTDPLFVFDLTDPASPRMLGELKIPGFSTYMHPMDENHLLAVGFDADDHGDFAFFDGIQIQIFDVSELASPRLLHKTTIGTRGSTSEGLTNHLAFNYFPSKGMLALPMTICDGGDDGVYGDKLSFSGLMVFDVSLEKGIAEHGRMPFVKTDDVIASYGGSLSCNSWWASSTSDVKRSIFMDDYAIGISDSTYQVAPLADLGGVVGALPLGGE